MSCEQPKVLSKEDASKIRNWGERIFALACLEKSCLEVEYQIPVNGKTCSVIDFRVTNIKSGRSRLVEVTETPRDKVFDSERKERQVRNLKQNGEPFTVLTLENLASIVKHLSLE